MYRICLLFVVDEERDQCMNFLCHKRASFKFEYT